MKSDELNRNQSLLQESKLLDKYFKNSCTLEEIDTLFRWLIENSDQPEKKRILKTQWERSVSKADPDEQLAMQQRLDKIHLKINLADSGYDSPVINNDKFRILKRRQLLYLTAVILFLPVLTLFIYIRFFQNSEILLAGNQKPVMNEIVSPIGSRISLELSDGTRVWLNHGSKLRFPQKFTGKKRIVSLDGEGYFEVKHNPDKPFAVKINEFTVTALGTKFNINAYSNDKTFSTTLESGSIEVETAKGEIEMKPSQHLEFSYNTNKFDLQNVNPEKYISWKDGKLIFTDDNFENVAQRLSRWYNVDIEILDPKVNNLTYTATFIDEPLTDILEMLAVVTPIQYQISGRHKLPDGTYSKRIIKVYMKN